MSPHTPKPDELLSFDAMNAFQKTQVSSSFGRPSNYYTQVNELMNGLAQIQLLRRIDTGQEKSIGAMDYYNIITIPLKQQFLPEQQTYQGLSDMQDISSILSKRLHDIDNALQDPEKNAHNIPTKTSMHRTLNEAYATLNPDTKEGQYYRAILEESAKILEILALGKVPSPNMGGGGEVSGDVLRSKRP